MSIALVEHAESASATQQARRASLSLRNGPPPAPDILQGRRISSVAKFRRCRRRSLALDRLDEIERGRHRVAFVIERLPWLLGDLWCETGESKLAPLASRWRCR
jgi:hypothetical protein